MTYSIFIDIPLLNINYFHQFSMNKETQNEYKKAVDGVVRSNATFH